jgi:hypothetical protein
MTAATFWRSSEQKKVIAHRGGHLQVIACAGAGKTKAISRRVSSLIEEGVGPAQIVAFTFTEPQRQVRRPHGLHLGLAVGEPTQPPYRQT